jgi:hypothetical protein
MSLNNAKPCFCLNHLSNRPLMARFKQKREGCQKSTNPICPTILKKLEQTKSKARNYISQWSNDLVFEVDHSHKPRRIVNLRESCGCGRWQLNGIPCRHVCCAIYANREVPKKYISKWYLVKTYLKSYAPNISPMPRPSD